MNEAEKLKEARRKALQNVYMKTQHPIFSQMSNTGMTMLG